MLNAANPTSPRIPPIRILINKSLTDSYNGIEALENPALEISTKYLIDLKNLTFTNFKVAFELKK